MISVEQAFQLIGEAASSLLPEQVDLQNLVGRILLEPVIADVDSPPHDKSMMDGWAVRSQDIQPGAEYEITETVIAGAVPTKALSENQVARIMTGAPLPKAADAVVMVELSIPGETESTVKFEIDSVRPEHHILRSGANFSTGQTLFPAGHQVRPTDIGLLAEVGIASARACKTPSVAVLPTGNELVNCDQRPGPGQIRNSNGPMLLAMLRSAGAATSDLGVGRDDPADLRANMQKGLEHDILILSGGVSAGEKDLVPGILKSLGVKEVFHKVKVKPGKPVWFGVSESSVKRTLVFGLPGNPVSSLVGFQLFVRAALRVLAGGSLASDRAAMASLACDHQTRGDRPTYWPGQLLADPSITRSVIPLKWNGSSDLLALGRADGLIYFSADQHDHSSGKEVSFLPF
jgi:molybdopterin molybdotransferase